MAELITISGGSGAGKTTISQLLVEKNPNSRLFLFDDLEDKIEFPDSYPGAMAEEYDLSKLAEFINAEKDKESGLIVFDYPFGRLNQEFNYLIDFAVFLKVPLDVSMARRTRREMRNYDPKESAWLLQQLENWESGARDFCSKWEEITADSCDLVVNGISSPEKIVREIQEFLNKKNN